ncbi:MULTISPECIES: deoxyribose-phosphate aldolase [Arthrospira]|jgi:deoxyribose-phosphate aldolase|uniref:Deoxyribose-phosphate aldolase n=1 Tax=Limnospira platensis NIES-46 TaxID=1236695 RepID=A0A5M3T4Y7_LIMPL|nr:deoxyribose-phosphate aldolase [Arthrospira platensis]AMW26857.1 2-deoxyribose-5-phosphate aldolase [Arthrospira platensis YZ]KDR57346.1 deoxyribose-phosphate aldolase [Arthrospira platensis str. Paraca]MBD2669342.1 deoxyribose-phosphate aldolase [Arthrospira platensis FACHB-439]MBD2709760.1 deoxyribose-phosphate aldolase [Arthrospira platensis FACHB-835]MDF2211761.1 deoxyribose-phosphate aldolase [Arthrospira platensis NCB002]MDT9182286.1 deoxyribose-phosphate aldolase [Limnospira sp. PMC
MMRESYDDIDIAPLIDHTLLNQMADDEQIKKCCEEADRYNFASVCIFPTFVKLARELLQNKKPKVCTVIGFPCGANTSAVKLYEALEAVENGATELDVVINLSWLKSGKTNELNRELAEICEETGVVVKAILETAVLTDAEKRLAAELAIDAGVSYLKTSTGYYGGATVEDVSLLKQVARSQVGIKASGGIRTHEQAIALWKAGATRLGTSGGVQIIRNGGHQLNQEN